MAKKDLKKNILIDLGKALRRFYIDNPNRVLYIGVGIFIAISLIPVYITNVKKTNDKAFEMYDNGLNAFKQALYNNSIEYEQKIQLFQRSKTFFNNVKTIYPHKKITSDAIFYLANCNYHLGDPNSSIEMYKLYYKKYRKRDLAPLALDNIASIYEQIGDYKNAITNYMKLAKDFEGKSYAAKAYYQLGLCYEVINDLNKANDAYNNVLSRYPNTIWANDAQLKQKWLESKFKYYGGRSR